MKLFYLIFFHIVIFSSSVAQAKIEYRVKVGANGIQWENAVDISADEKVISNWHEASSLGLPTVKSWVPSTFVVPPAKGIKFFGYSTLNGSDSIEVSSFSVTGMQYNTIGIASSKVSSGIGSGCNSQLISGSVIDVRGDNCVSNIRIDNDILSVPFVLYRPIISIDNAELLSALDGSNQGVYSASVPVSIKVPYYIGSTLTYRQFSDVIIIVIDYDPVWITNVDLIPENVVLQPIYYPTSRLVSSNEAAVQVKVDGYFSNGIRLSLLDNNYFLENTNNVNIKIPYYIHCKGCGANRNENKVLVNDSGTILNQWVTIGSGVSLINDPIIFNLAFGYIDVDGTTLTSGEYMDTVNFAIEPEI
jgi:hypothetical protein